MTKPALIVGAVVLTITAWLSLPVAVVVAIVRGKLERAQ